MLILGIETSCDETSLALLEANETDLTLHEHVVSSQAAAHSQYGGVVPEVAARKHSEVIEPLLNEAIGRERLAECDLIAVTVGPGLVTSLMVGVQTAKTLAHALQTPLIGINHLEAHIYANWLSHKELINDASIFPSLVLLVSGGHTMFVIMRGHGQYEIIGQTVDDAVGEAFDKVAKMLELGYPGGPIISTLAEKGNPAAILFPRPMLANKGFDVSFSGLKTSVLYYLQKQGTITKKDFPDIAASFQQAAIDLLIGKAKKAVEQHKPHSVMLVGGVSANKDLQKSCMALGSDSNIPVFVPGGSFTGDNAAMIAAAGFFQKENASADAWKDMTFNAQLKLA